MTDRIPVGAPDKPLDMEEPGVQEAVVENLRKMLETQPFTVLNIHPRPDDVSTCPVVYTVGLIRHGFPEIIAGADLDIKMLATLVDNVGHGWMEGKEVTVGTMTQVLLRDPDGNRLSPVTRYIDADAIADQAAVSVLKAFYGGMMPVMVQLMVPSLGGKLPTDEGYDQHGYFQPLLKALNETPGTKH